MKTRIEVDSDGNFFTLIPEDVMLEYELYEGDQLEWDIDQNDFIIINYREG